MKIAEIIGLKEPVPYKPAQEMENNCSHPDLVMGVEIETELCNHQDWYEGRLTDLWEIKTDGSLRGRAFEFVSKPAELKVLIPELHRFYEATGFTERNYSDRCSIHVHTNITNLTVEQVGTLSLIYSIVEELLFEFVNKYKAPDTWGYSRDTNIYCVPWAQCRMNHNVVKTMFSDLSFAFRNWQKYTALNLLPARSIGTVEWRHMHGTADMEKITKWLNIIGSIVKYAQGNEFRDVVKIIKELNDNSAYRQFYTEIFRDYLPYTDEYATAIATGVVNAKYAMMDLKDGEKPVIKKAAKATGGSRFADIFGNLNELRAAADQWPLDPPVAVDDGPTEQVAPARPQRARANPAPAPAAYEYPLWRTILRYTDANGRNQITWGAVDAVGRMFDSRGARIEARRDDLSAGGLVGWTPGFGGQFWNTVNEDWRPARNDENAQQLG